MVNWQYRLRKKNLNKSYSGRNLLDILNRFDLKNYRDVRDQSNKKADFKQLNNLTHVYY